VYTEYHKYYEGKDIDIDFYSLVGNATMFLNVATFDLAHWLFAFNYWALSWRIELIKNHKSPDTYNCRLNTINITMSLITVLIPATDWVLNSYNLFRDYLFVGLTTNVCLAISCYILV
jgi:dimeric dUTPase (all-alpha-NTP-PPase superfamily)